MNINFASLTEIQKARKCKDIFLRAKIFSDIFRLNALYMIMNAGSGHPGTTLSSLDIATWLWIEEMKNPNEPDKDYSDTYFSSKGHDVPGLYSILLGLGKLDFELIHKLRRLHGLPGHPHVEIPYLITNTGSLGMGISKAHGMALANRLKGKQGRFYVLTGDGELDEGQIWESLQPAVNGKLSQITVIVDHNKIQSDIHVKDTSDLGDLENKFKAFGWAVHRCDGHDFQALQKAFAWARGIKDKPQVIIADTIKGKGVSVMEKMGDDGLYKFHSGAPSPENYQIAVQELTQRINQNLKSAGLPELQLEARELPVKTAAKNPLRLNTAHGDELTKIARERRDVVALDADLVLDTGLIPFKKEFPDRYFECGIAEQDMVSVAGGLALRGIVPVVHSFACFLSTRPNEQIYNNATEKTKIIYVASLAGFLPATPGHSHQSVRDISAVGSVPGLTMIEPSNEIEARLAIRWAVWENSQSTYIRICNVPAEVSYSLPADYRLELGKGVLLADGKDIVIIGYGPVMLEQAMKARAILSESGISAAVVNLPWLNKVNGEWLMENVKGKKLIVTLDDHYVTLGQGAVIAQTLSENSANHPKLVSFGLTEIPECGQNGEVLAHHSLDSQSIAKRIKATFSRVTPQQP